MRHWILLTSLALFIATANTFAVERLSTDDLTRRSFSGRVTSIHGQEATVQTVSGSVTVNLGPQSYWNDRGYHLRSGVDVDVVGWYDRGRDDYCYGGSIAGRGFNYELCDSHGYPYWADRNDCDDHWRPRRSSFNIFFSLGSYHGFDCAPPPRVHHGHHYDHCPPRHWDRHHHDRGRHDRDHGNWNGRDNNRGRDGDRDHGRDRGNDRPGRRGRG